MPPRSTIPKPKPKPHAPAVLSAREEQRLLLKRMLVMDEARDDILAYARLTMPHPKFPADPDLSLYQVAEHHRVIAEAIHQMEAGRFKNLIINMPPRHGKTELATKRHSAWYAGRNPEKSVIVGTYNETFAGDLGRTVRDIIQSPAHHAIFPESGLKPGSEASDRLVTDADGMLAFVGRGGSITGRGGDLIIIDDPIKDDREAQSPTVRDTLWSWFTRVVMSRRMDKDARVLVIQTRWHEDDLVGRLTDPTNPCYDEDEARDWKIIDLPALAVEDNDVMGRRRGQALWPARFDEDYLRKMQRRDPRGFGALYQCRPTPEDGAFFTLENLKTYRPNELPKNLRYYVASDHAVATRQVNDETVLLPVGVDENNDIWVLPDIFWRRAASDVVVEAMLGLIKTYKPLYWWAEKGHITKSIGPFLRKRMLEEQLFTSIIELTPAGDKMTRAQSIQGRIAFGRVWFPEFAPWWPKARDQILKFPYGTHDDFVDALAYIGLGLISQVGALGQQKSAWRRPEAGTFAAMLGDSKARDRKKRIAKAAAGW